MLRWWVLLLPCWLVIAIAKRQLEVIRITDTIVGVEIWHGICLAWTPKLDGTM